jgi:hypothetical protein
MEIFDAPHPGESSFEDDYHRMAKSESRMESLVGRMILDLLDALRGGVIGPRFGAVKLLPNRTELWLQYANGFGSGTLITLDVDWKDCSPIVDGVPLLHYRLSYTRCTGDGLPKVELRTRDVRTAYEFVLEAIEQCKRSS